MSRRLLVCVPTVDGRDVHLERCLASIDAQATPGWEVQRYVWRNEPTCGHAWNKAIALARASYDALLLVADDLELATPDSLAAGLAWLDRGASPCALIIGPDGGIESHGTAWKHPVPYPSGTPTRMTRIPLGLTAWYARPIPPIHYYSDNAVSSLFEAGGVSLVCEPEFSFRHHWAQEGRQAMGGPRWDAEHAAWVAYDQDVRNDPLLAAQRILRGAS